MRQVFLAGAAVAALVMPAAVHAQQITSGIEGAVRDEAGKPIAGAEVVVTDTRTGVERTLTANNSGYFRADALVTGGPYTVAVSAAGFEGQTIQNIALTLQGNTSLDFNLTKGDGEIVVTAARANQTQLAIGPGQSFGEQDLKDFSSITRDIRDIIRIDPRVSLSRSNEVDRISCLGGNDRSNSFSVDGIVQSDTFGLNGTPFASRNAMPVPFDIIAETSVEFAPYDVQYGAFTGCAINVVTKPGANKFHGSAFFNYASDKLQGKSIGTDDFTPSPFKEKRWGATISGPILKDRLFFFGGYEETDLGDSHDQGPVDGGYGNPMAFITTAQFEEISKIIKDNYGIDSGPLARTLPETSRRFFGRLDWYINDHHRLEATYQRLDELNVEPDDFSSTRITGLNTFEAEGTQSNYYSLRLYSQWNDKLSTELRASRSEVQDVQGPYGGGEAQSDNPMPRIIVGVTNNGSEGQFLAGPGFSRTSNDLRTEINQYKALANLSVGNHKLTFGGEVNELMTLNLFGQNTTGTLNFSNIADLRAGLLSGGTNTNPSAAQILQGQGAGAYGNFTASGDIHDATAQWTRTTFTLYAQDKWQVTPKFDVLGGVRVDWMDGGAPGANPNFFERYGFTNAVPFSKIDPLVLPRLGFSYNFQNEGFFSRTQLTGGVGIFSGGDPTVVFMNAFQNNGFPLGAGSTGNNALCGPNGTRINVLAGGKFSGIPQCVRDQAAAQARGGLADTNSTDPNFQTPTVMRANIGLSTRFGGNRGFFSNWRLQLDYIYSRYRNPVTLVDLSQTIDPRKGLNGRMVDGRPLYSAIDPTVAGCDATLEGTGGSPPKWHNVSTACFNTQRDDEIQVTNGRSYDSHTVSVMLQKSFESGLFTPGGSSRFNFGYAFTKAQNNRYNNGTTAAGNFDGAVVFDLQDPAVATSEFEVRHNFTLGLSFREQFVKNYDTQFGFTFVGREGRPYSYTFNGNGVSTARFTDDQSGAGQLLYVPTGPNDPNVTYAPGTVGGVAQTPEQTAKLLNDYIDGEKCLKKFRGRSAERSSCRGPWFFDLDLRFSQDLPGPGTLFGIEDRINVFLDVDNFLNFLDSNWNVSRSRGTSINMITAGYDAQGRYVYSAYNPVRQPSIQVSSSLWRAQLGIKYSF
jgi:outer membrane receptor for ferrienterochelin and colicin